MDKVLWTFTDLGARSILQARVLNKRVYDFYNIYFLSIVPIFEYFYLMLVSIKRLKIKIDFLLETLPTLGFAHFTLPALI